MKRSPPHTEDDSARGRFAERFTQIPVKGWKDILLRVSEEIGNDRLSIVSAGVAFFLLLALFPALAALVSLYGLVSDPATLQNQLEALSGILPASAIDLIGSRLEHLVEQSSSSLSFGFLIGLGVAIWSTNSGFKALFEALNAAYDEQEKRGFLALNLVALAFSLTGLLTIAVLVGATVAVPALLAALYLGASTEWLISLARWPVLLLVITLAIGALYRWGPSRNPARWHWISWGGLSAAIVWVIFSAAFSFYLANFANYDATYGSLGAVIGVMMWTYLSVFILLVGAELNSEIEHQVLVDTTVGPHRPMGERGAKMADTVGEARAK